MFPARRPALYRRLRHSAALTALAALAGWSGASGAETFELQEATIEQVREALDAGAISSVELVTLYLNRVAAYDRHGPNLNSIPVLNPAALDEAAAADALRAAGGEAPLLGVPFTVKDSYKVKGLTVASGSPAFAGMIANEDAFTTAVVRAAGGILIGKTNMPPLAEGGMEKGVYGRAESPYNGDYLTAAFRSGSSNGSGTSTAANFAMFGMGEETVSSGRSPASNNALIAYTPSRGMLSIRGNWPLYPVRDVVVPHTRSMEDMLRLLDVIQVTDPITVGDFWRDQKVVPLPRVEDVRPADMMSLARTGGLRGKRIGVPTMYLGKDPAGERPITVRPSILTLWEKAAADLRALGAEVVEVDFPLMHNYEIDRPSAKSPVERGLIPRTWFRTPQTTGTPPDNHEWTVLNPYFAEQFVRLNGDPNVPSWEAIDPKLVFPVEPEGTVANRDANYEDRRNRIVAGLPDPATLPHYAEALRGAETMRKIDFEDWMKAEGLDLVAFPSAADIGRADANMNPHSYEEAMRNGVYFSNMNSAMRHLGIPSVSVPMGEMDDTRMPVNLTFIGAAYTDPQLLSYAYDYEQATLNRRPPTRAPALPDEVIQYDRTTLTAPAARTDKTPPSASFRVEPAFEVNGGRARLTISGLAWDNEALGEVRLYVNGQRLPVTAGSAWRTTYEVPADRLADPDLMLLAFAKDQAGNATASLGHYAVSAEGRLTRLDNPPPPSCDICS